MSYLYIYWFALITVCFLLFNSYSYSELEEGSSSDKSAKHYMIFNVRSYIYFSIVIFFMVTSIFINR